MSETKIYYPARRVGNTTRIVDWTIQKLFEGEEVECLDHHEYGENRKANSHLMSIILQRLAIEHQIDKNMVIVNKEKQTIKLNLK